MKLHRVWIGMLLPCNSKSNDENQCHGTQCIVIPPFGRATCGNDERCYKVTALSQNEQNEQKPKAAIVPFLQRTPDKSKDGNVKPDQPDPSQNMMELGVIRPAWLIKMPRQCVSITQDLNDRGQGNEAGRVFHFKNISSRV